ncbi:hypothetical protein ASE14_12790 [Agromyces sp. Root81]|uniref:hypothetical protein n=1 Tax=Agromyces sp. Root81 TaxID=1736601 RepID=UPI0006FE60BA|nr:hypothetical protein [Agromyces sp. Root81]KRC61702.1 hypothetical protein ASE14_12790 [Agromyces sp. Root81]
MAKYDLSSTPLKVLLEAPDSRAVIDELLPELPTHPMIGFAQNMNADQVLKLAGGTDAARVEALRAALEAL